MRLDSHAYKGPPRRIGSSWSAVEANPPSVDGWAAYAKTHHWDYDREYADKVLFRTDFDAWVRQSRVAARQVVKSQEQQAKDLLAKLLCPKQK